MGRGDRKTAKGKIAIRSYGNVRPHKKTLTADGATRPIRTSAKPHKAAAAPAKPAAVRKTATRAPAKKAATKKTASKKTVSKRAASKKST